MDKDYNMRIYPKGDTMRKQRTTPKKSINLYWTDEQQRLLEIVAPKLIAQGAPGITKTDGSYNLSAVINYLLKKEAGENPNS